MTSLKNAPEIVYLEKGARHNLHPKLSILDRIPCVLMYNRKHKFMLVEYDLDKSSNYQKSLMTTSVDTVEEIISEFISNKYGISIEDILHTED